MKRHVRVILGFVAASALVLAACAGPDSSPDPSSPPTSGLFGWLVEEEVPVGSSIVVDVAGLPTADPNDPRVAVGLTVAVDARVEFSGVRAAGLSTQPDSVAYGALRRRGDGFAWSAVVEANGASALRFELTDVFLPRNAELYLYTDRGEVDGPYVDRGPFGDGSFWTGTLRGDRVFMQLHYHGSDTDRVLAATRFVVSSAGYLDRRFELARYSRDADTSRGFCSFNAPCTENAACSGVPSHVQAAQDAVALMLFTSGRYQYICTGGLIADTDPASAIPYFLTANHCIAKSKEAKSLQTYFHFQTPCNGSCDLDDSAFDTKGATIRASNKTSDYTLLELTLSDPLPAGAAFLEYDNTPIAYDDGASLFRISHPGGAPQAYSEHVVDTAKGTCGSWPRGNWIYSRDTLGATEGGSSGSPVLNAAGKVVGQLSGGCGTNVGDDCDSENNATVNGAFAAYWEAVAPYLDPNTTCTDADGDGYCAETDDCDDADENVNPGSPEVCDDGVDNDCDEAIDEGCGGGCDLGQLGDPCSSSADCCSNKCKGKPGAKTCK